jgi:hypothetical protein
MGRYEKDKIEDWKIEDTEMKGREQTKSRTIQETKKEGKRHSLDHLPQELPKITDP